MTFKELRITQRFKLNIGYYTKLDDNNARVYAPGKRKPPIVRVRPEEPVVPVADFPEVTWL